MQHFVIKAIINFLRPVLLLLLSFFALSGKTQMVNLQQLLTLRTQPIPSVEEFLTIRKWEVINVEKENDKNYGTIAFGFERRSGSFATAFIEYKYTSRATSFNMISISFDNNVNLYAALINELKSLGFTVFNSEVTNNQILKFYKKGDIIIAVHTTTYSNNEGTAYGFVIAKDKNTFKGFNPTP
jgi:hypothetical protein